MIDAAQAIRNPKRAVIHVVPAGCNPVRLVLSPDGKIAYVAARGDHRLLAFDASKLIRDPARAALGSVPVGTAPVGVAAFADGRRVIVTSSNRFAGGESDKQPLFVIDSSKLPLTDNAVLGVVQAGAFPREMRTSSDGRWLFVTNYNSRTLQLIDLSRLQLQAAPSPDGAR